MTCSYCGARNSQGEHRCRRCGRKPDDTLTGDFTPRTDGALAAMPRPIPCLQPASPPALRAAPNLARAVQGSLFQERPVFNVSPFEALTPNRVGNPIPTPAHAKSDTRPKAASKSSGRRASRIPEGQGRLEFLAPEPVKARKLSTTVEAVIFCEAPVATTLHRAVA